MRNRVKVYFKKGKVKVYPFKKYRLITAIKTGGVVIAAIVVIILFCGAIIDERHTPEILPLSGIVTSAVVVIAFGTYLLSEKPSDPKKRKDKKK